MYKQYRDRVAFYIVYIREAHPSDAWQVASNVKDEVVYASPENSGERVDLANVCVKKLGIDIPALVDNFDNATDTAYSGWPDRLYLIDRDGKIAYKSGPGPFGFKPDELENAIAETLAR
jgi:type I thyroxine 5'-deiodinase